MGNPDDIMTNHMHAQTNKTVLDKYMKLDQGTRVQALYIWIDGTGEGLRSKTKTLEEYPNSVADLPIWNYMAPHATRLRGPTLTPICTQSSSTPTHSGEARTSW